MNYNKLNKMIALFLVELILILPIYSSALTISNIQVDATDKSATVTWLTDEESVTKINYGADKNNLNGSVSEVALIKDHSVLLRDLEKSTAYFFELIAQTPTEILVDGKSGEYYKFVTLEEDIVPPFIDVEIPEAVDSNELDIFGQTEIDTKIELFINGQLRRAVDFADGEINFYGVDLLPNEQNAILIQATDTGGNTAQKQFSVYSDLVAPIITLTPELPDVIATNAVNLAGQVSEQALINITLNDVPVHSAEAAVFSFNAQFTEGENSLVITASDKAGHITVFSKTIYSDMLPPTITEVTPNSGSFYYEGRAIMDLQLTTEPGSEVRVFRDARGILARYDESKIAGDTGKVRFDDVELEGPYFGPYSITAEWPSVRQVQSTTGTTSLSYQSQQQTEASERQVRLIIAVRDRAGHVTTQALSYTIGTCWSGELDFHIIPLLEYQSPTLLSPERLAEGSELISFVLNVNYTGTAPAEEWKITDVKIDRACRGGRLGEPEFFLEDDIRYDISCSVLPNAPTSKDRNSAGTLWYVRYDLASTEEFTDFTELDWEEVGRHELVFPLKLTVRYKEMEIDSVTGKKRWSAVKTQTKCMSVAYFVDIPIDPRDVLPDWMLEDLPEGLNDTINTLDGIVNVTEEITEYVAMGCLGSLIIKFILKVSRRIRCRLETNTAKIAKATGQSYTCPPTEEGRLSLPLNEKTDRAASRTIKTSDPVTAIYLAESCPGCASAWKAEAALYQVERWLCDRVFCHKAPARWTGYDKGVEDEDIKLAKEKSKSCGAEEKAGVRDLRKIENCDREYGKYSSDNKLIVGFEKEKICYLLKEPENTLYVEGTDLGPVNDVYTLTKASEKGSGKNKLKVIKEGSNYATARTEKCDAICKGKDKNSVGECETLSACNETKSDLDVGSPQGYSSDCWVKENALEDPKKQCCCRVKKEEEPTKKLETQVDCKPGDKDCQPWEYREQELNRKDKNKYGTYFPEDRYFPGRDAPACFGQNRLFDSPAQGQAGKQPTIDPFRQHLSAFQCGCLTGIRQRLIMLRSILTGMMNCLNQISETGEADAGVCKELFTRYICDMTYQVYTWFKSDCAPDSFGSDKGKGAKDKPGEDPLAIGFSEFFGSLSTLGSSISEEYGSSQFSNFLGGGEKQFARKICLAAFGFDVGLDFDTFLDMTYNVQFASSILGLGLRRDFLTYNPDNELATYAYRGSWTIYPGCAITSYKVDLTCINQEEKSKYNGIDCTKSSDPENPGGCDCLTSSAPYAARSRTFYTGGPLAASSLEDKDNHMNVEAQHRFDHIRVQLFLNPESNPSQCLPTGHDDAIFYFPISDNTARDLLDCTVDDLTGSFECTRGMQWEQKGEAYFDYFDEDDCDSGRTCSLLCKDPHDNDQYRDCEIVVFTKGDRIDVKAKIQTKGKQCLNVKLDSEGVEAYSETHDIGRGTYDSGADTNTIEFTRRLGTVSDDYFSGTGTTLRSKSVDRTNVNCTIVTVPEHPKESSKTTGTLNIEFEKVVEVGITKYKLKSTPGDLKIYDQSGSETGLSNPRSFSEIEKLRFKFSGFIFKFTKVDEGKCTIETKRGSGRAEQKWPLSLELMHPDSQNSCGGTNERISVVAEDTSVNLELNVNEEYTGPIYYLGAPEVYFNCEINYEDTSERAYLTGLVLHDVYGKFYINHTPGEILYDIYINLKDEEDVEIGWYSQYSGFSFIGSAKSDLDEYDLSNVKNLCKQLNNENFAENFDNGINSILPGTEATYKQFFENCENLTQEQKSSRYIEITDYNDEKEEQCEEKFG